MGRYLVGIDLGTTNIAVAFVDTASKAAGGPRLHTFHVPQVVAAGQVQEHDLLPSFLYIPGPHDLAPGAIDLPWKKNPTDTAGLFARNHGSKVPGRQVSSAKSWLCHPGVDRTAPLLPWAGPPDVPRLSPLEVSAKYLKHIVEAWNNAPNRKDADKLEEQTVVVTVPASFDDVARNLTAEAAKQAGLKHVTLLEEPQAAFYAWLGTHSPQEAGMLRPGMRCLVVDVGGGTSDFSLIRAGEEKGELTFIRDAVGDHLLLGGDNMDLALAKAVEQKLPGGRLDAAQFGSLVQACRGAKEALLSAPPPPSYPVTVMGKGRSVVGGTVSVNITPADVAAALFDGFFPLTAFDSAPAQGARTGLQEMGLPYVSDAAVSKHLAAFIRQHVPTGESVDAILFNGGVFQPEVLRERVIDVMRPWFDQSDKKWDPLVLTSPSLDLAVAWGAAYFAWLKHSGGRRIGGGIPRSYYVAVETDTPGRGMHAHSVPVLCVVPRRMQEGEEIHMPAPVLELALGEPVLFPLYTSTVRGDDKPGQVLRLQEESLMRLPPLHTILRGGKRAGAKRVPVTLAAKCTEIGTLELYCESKEGNRWRLEFNVRDVLREPTKDDVEDTQGTVIDVFPEEKVQAAAALIAQVFGDPGTAGVPPASGASEAGGTPAAPGVTTSDLPKLLEAALESPRSDWPTGLCRRVWEFLEANAPGRARSPGHLSRWYNLTGYTLRPGFGDPVDRYRVEALWKMITAAASGQTQTSGPKKMVVPEGGADYWIMWRRVSGGLNAALQQALFSRLKPTLLPVKGKAFSRPPANEYAEMWRAAASLERLDAKTRETLGAAALRDCKKSPVPTYAFWALTRFGARVQFYGPLNSVVHPEIVEQWIDELLPFTPANDSEKNGWLFCLSQLARQSGLRAVDISDSTRNRVLGVLRAHPCPAAWKRMVEEVVAAEGEEASRLFGESLPIGLRLSGG
ncbi:Chaperone protein HscA [Gemmata sp. SH-PL17]|uniref:hsp70 family protein n=1 Tax=Gemmata sp. SH-PL17 TaxID=1630693 RepID=UPI00078D6B6D|nr:hsp70 family protein [Gemmata sp. SH-PL17]AMV29044.1 Chaperone protein HscA [Gemmata sp. SH-PL17]